MLRTLTSTVLLIALAAPLSAGDLSFACRMEKTARAMATCANAELAATDLDVQAAFESTFAHVDAETASALREDQKKYLADLDRGFESSVWGKADPPQGAALRGVIAQMRLGADGDPLAALEVRMRERIAFLRSLAPFTSVTGLWKNNNAELLIAHVDPDLSPQARNAKGGVNFGDDDRGRYDATFGMALYGFAQDHCHFTAVFRAAPEGLRASGVRNTDPEVEQDIAGNLLIARTTPMALTLTQALSDGVSSPDQHRVCPHLPALTGPLFHTGLKADQVFRLKTGAK
ncbi:MAG TPA: hypothetical protein VMF32_10360 [Xanthobacteraceae bacterium]|nr:hypothetical protein [Xanthobacteraceae bacterium]